MVASTSIAAQLQAIKSFVKADAQPLKRPFTRPSLLFDPKEAADTDIDTIFSIALSGLESLVKIDERFRNYKNDLFSHQSLGVDRELMGIEENNQINRTITSYLRLVSGHLRLPSAFKTLEYLVRRYKIYVYNMEELLLCALPYHDTHAFVRVVQLVDLGNSKWKFLEGVKQSGAPPPRKVIVQQCIQDFGVLESLCSYATPTKKEQQSVTAISFCIAVVVEVLGYVTTVDSDLVNRVLPFVSSGIQTGAKGLSDYKAGALMIVGVLTNRATLSPKLVKSLLRSIAELSLEAAEESTDVQLLQMTMMTLISIVQLQSVATVPKKALDSIIRLRDLPQIISGLARKFNIEKFLTVFLLSITDYSESDDLYKPVLASLVENVPVKGIIHLLVSRLLSTCLRVKHNVDSSDLPESGAWVKQVLVVINNKYPGEFRKSLNKFMQDEKVQSRGETLVYKTLCRMLDGSSHVEISDSKIWFALEHPKAETRRSALCSLDMSKVLDGSALNHQRLTSLQDAVIHRLYDDDLSVVRAALSLNRLSELVGSTKLLDVLQDILKSTFFASTVLKQNGSGSHLHSVFKAEELLPGLVGALLEAPGLSADVSSAGDICLSCLELAVANFGSEKAYMEELASMVFPFLLVSPKIKRLSEKALELVTKIKWPFYRKLYIPENSGKDLSSRNTDIISGLAEVYSESPEKYTPWLVKCSENSELSKTVFILVLHQSCVALKSDARISSLFRACFEFLKAQWIVLEQYGAPINGEALDGSCVELLDQLRSKNHGHLSAQILVCTYWKLLTAYISAMPTDGSLDDSGEWFCGLRELYTFFAECKMKNVFREHLDYLVLNCKISLHLLSGFITREGFSNGVQVQSLRSLSLLCSRADETLALQLLQGFPSILVPVSSEAQDVRTAAMDFVEVLFSLCSRIQSTGKRNGNNEPWSSAIDGLLRLFVQQKKFIISDRSYLPSLLASALTSSHQSLLVPEERFDRSTVEEILGFILGFAMKLPEYAKLKILLLFRDVGASMMFVKDVQSLLGELLHLRLGYNCRSNELLQKLSNVDVDILCLLLEACCVSPSDVHHIQDHLLAVLQVDDACAADPAIFRPCITVLRKLNDGLFRSLTSETRELLLHKLVHLHQSPNIDVHNAARDAFLRLTIASSQIVRVLEKVDLSLDNSLASGSQVKKKSKKHHVQMPDLMFGDKSALCFVSSLLDILLLKKDIKKRDSLVKPLFNLLGKAFFDAKVPDGHEEKWVQASSGISQSIYSTICSIQQIILLILEDIIGSLTGDIISKDSLIGDSDIKMLVDCARSAKEVPILNQALSLFSTVTKIMPTVVLTHIQEILAVTCKSAFSQEDSYSKSVFEDLIAAVVPCWLSNGNDTYSLLQIFIEVMADVAQHRRQAVVLHLLRTLGEEKSLGSLFTLLLRSLVSSIKSSIPNDRKHLSEILTSATQMEWEYTFALQICEQYSSSTWLPSLVMLLKLIQAGDRDQELFLELLFATKFVSEKLQDPELLFKLDSGDDSNRVQGTLGELLEQLVCSLELVESRRESSTVPPPVKKELKELLRVVLRNMTKRMTPSTLFTATSTLMGRAERSISKKALRLLSEALRDIGSVKLNRGREPYVYISSSWDKLGGRALDTLGTLCLGILQLIDHSHNEDPDQSLKLAAVSAIEVLAARFPSDHPVANKCLATVVKMILSDDLPLASSCLRTTGTLVNLLGARALPELPGIMANVLKRSKNLPSTLDLDAGKLMLALLVTLEALVEKLGAFLNPHLRDILELVVLNPSYVSDSDQKLKTKAEAVRRLLTEQIPVRLALPPLLKLYPEAVKSGDLSVQVVFEMLTGFVGRLDKASVSTYHGDVFSLLLLGLDLRRQRHSKIERVHVVEEYAINAMVALTMKLTETMFKPLFIRCIDWVESDLREEEHAEKIDRAISFYRLVNKLAESHRSLFVPYFKYLLNGCIEYLTDIGQSDAPTKKKKKAKLGKEGSQKVGSDAAAAGKWHLRALVLSSLQKCFLYDTGRLKFLDSSNFQVLLKPVVTQMVVEPPSSLEEEPDVPSVKEVDDLLVSCIGQMAAAAGSDLQWKPLNYEVLMQTRSEMVRARILGLRIVKSFIDNLKEEYLVLLAETIPFLVELLEDVELSVKTLAQETLKELETLSGENLRQYF